MTCNCTPCVIEIYLSIYLWTYIHARLIHWTPVWQSCSLIIIRCGRVVIDHLIWMSLMQSIHPSVYLQFQFLLVGLGPEDG